MTSSSIIHTIAPEIVNTVILLIGVVLVNFAITAVLRTRARLSRETKLRASVFWRNFLLLVAVVLLIIIWRTEIRTAALSLAALSVALVLAGKELLTSVLGYIHRTTSRSFEFGNIIEINGVKGEVIDQTLLSTTVLEMNDAHLFTGRVTQFPNSFYVAHPLRNHSRLGKYQLGLMVIPLAGTDDIDRERDLLLEAAGEVCSEHIEPAERSLRALEGEQFVVMPSAEPRVNVILKEPGKVELTLRFPCLAEQRTQDEQEILSRYLAARQAGKAAGNSA